MAINELIEGYVSRQEAKQKKLTRYFTGKSCKHGHIVERLTVNGACCKCASLSAGIIQQRYRKEKRYNFDIKSLTQEQLKIILLYIPTTGEWFWKKAVSKKIKVGRKAGTIDGNGYLIIGIYGKREYLHLLAHLYMTGKWPKDEIDHKDRNRANCKWDNIREATSAQNKCNKQVQSNNKLGIKNIYFDNQSQRYCVNIQYENTRVKKLFATLDEAIEFRNEKIKEIQGKFSTQESLSLFIPDENIWNDLFEDS